MAKQSSFGADLIRAAGGLLWRRAGSGYEIAVIHRARHHDWTLPKGKLDPGESWETAALREVHEETGFRAKILAFAGAVAYPTEKGPKLVRFWHMLLEPGPQGPLDDEVSEVVWLPVEEARQRLDYDLERALLEVWNTPESVTA